MRKVVAKMEENNLEEIKEFPEQSTFNEDDMSEIIEEEEKKDEDKND